MGVLTHIRAAGAAGAALAALLAAAPATAQDDAKQALDAACRARMQSFAEVEAANAERIVWEVVPGGVRGTYVGYAPGFACRMGDPHRDPPTARLSYQEVVYEKRGDSVRAATAAAPKPLEIREVTVVLLFRDGHWR